MKGKQNRREPLTSDIIFKAVYGRDDPDSKAALIALLNLVLGYDDDPIVDIIYKNPFSIDDTYDGKTIIMDIKAETDKGEIIDIEMQVGELAEYIKRTIYYECRQISDSLASGEDYGKIKKSIIISFVKGKLFPPNVPLHTVFRIHESNIGMQLEDVFEMHFVELDKIRYNEKRPEELSSLEQLGAYLKCSGDPNSAEYVEELVTIGDEVIEMTDKVLKTISEEERLRELRLAREKMELRIAMEKRTKYEQGLAQGIAQTAANFKAAGIPIDVIAANTGLTEEEIAKL